MFYIIVSDIGVRTRLINYLKSQDILSVFHYIPLHSSPMGLIHDVGGGEFPVTDRVSETLLRLPCYYEFTLEDQDRVIKAIKSFFSTGGEG